MNNIFMSEVGNSCRDILGQGEVDGESKGELVVIMKLEVYFL